MNIIQSFLVALFKASHDLYEKTLTDQEQKFAESFRASPYFTTLKVGNILDGTTVLMWKSKVGPLMACYVFEKEIRFSHVDVVIEEQLSMPIDIYFPYEEEKWNIVKKEIEDIKTLLLAYSDAIKWCFT